MSFLVGPLLVVVQILAALPWVFGVILNPGSFGTILQRARNPKGPTFLWGLALLGAALALPFVLSLFVQEKYGLELMGQSYAALLQAQLLFDIFVLAFTVLLRFWPKGGAVAMAAFREGVRQPMFWLLFGVAFMALGIWPFIPYFTFGEDHIMAKEMGYDSIMLVAVVFGCLAATLFVTEEIEGRTAVTLMSKPVSRRQFLVGKYVGILLSSLLMVGLLGTFFQSTMLFKRAYDQVDPVPLPSWVSDPLEQARLTSETTDFVRGVLLWGQGSADVVPGLVMSFGQVMVLVSLSVALATRVPMVVNLVTILVVYFLAHLTPILLLIGQKAALVAPDSPVARLVLFTAQVFDTLLPGLEFFQVSPAVIGDTPLPVLPYLLYLGSVSVYALLYSVLALLLGLILFEDRDLA